MLELSLSVAVPPTQIGLVLVAPVDVGRACTVTDVVYTVAGLHPLPVLLTTNEYTPDADGVAVGVCKDDAKPAGPVHDQAVALLE